MIFFKNVVNEHSASPRMLIVHEVMGRDCGWLTAGELPPLSLPCVLAKQNESDARCCLD
jgi:hypothetical protein